jgi:hypothetical protein
LRQHLCVAAIIVVSAVAVYLDGERPAGDGLDDDAQPVAPVISDTETVARCLWTAPAKK